MRSSIRFFVLSAILLVGACDRHSGATSPTTPTPTPPSVTELSISGLPDPLLLDIPSALKAGDSYDPRANATYSDGSIRTVESAAATWASDNPSVASFDGSRLQAHREGLFKITVTVRVGGQEPTKSRDLTVWAPGGRVRQARAERIQCGKPVCPYPFCPESGPFWLFPVHETGTIELIDAVNPGWGSPGQYVTQLSPKGEFQRHHNACRSFFEEWTGPVVSTEAVLTEATHLLRDVDNGPSRCIEFFLAGGAVLVPSNTSSLERVQTLIRKHADLPMDFADATLVALGEELNSALVFTTDRTDFAVYRLKDRRPFALRPETLEPAPRRGKQRRT
jgi:predicted nucleic acid-binding protein